jgi:hypothetical protein
LGAYKIGSNLLLLYAYQRIAGMQKDRHPVMSKRNKQMLWVTGIGLAIVALLLLTGN